MCVCALLVGERVSRNKFKKERTEEVGERASKR